MCCQRGENRKLAGKRFGRRNTDFGARMRGQQKVRLTRHAGRRHVNNDRDGLAIFLAMPQRRQRICSLARLGYE